MLFNGRQGNANIYRRDADLLKIADTGQGMRSLRHCLTAEAESKITL